MSSLLNPVQSPRIPCDVFGCPITCSRPADIQRHKKEVHGTPRFCPFGDYEVRREYRFFEHLEREHRQNPNKVFSEPLQCSFCKYTSSWSQEILSHMEIHDKRKAQSRRSMQDASRDMGDYQRPRVALQPEGFGSSGLEDSLSWTSNVQYSNPVNLNATPLALRPAPASRWDVSARNPIETPQTRTSAVNDDELGGAPYHPSGGNPFTPRLLSQDLYQNGNLQYGLQPQPQGYATSSGGQPPPSFQSEIQQVSDLATLPQQESAVYPVSETRTFSPPETQLLDPASLINPMYSLSIYNEQRPEPSYSVTPVSTNPAHSSPSQSSTGNPGNNPGYSNPTGNSTWSENPTTDSNYYYTWY